MDCQQRLLLEAAHRCLAAVGLERAPADCGVFVGASSSDFAQRAYAELVPRAASGDESAASLGYLMVRFLSRS